MSVLDNILVVAIEQAVAAPLATARLSDGGARVIKIERADGETARHYDRTVKGTSAYFAWLNRGKESAVLDLKNPQDLAVAHAMVARADVFVQNLAPGAAARLGLGGRDLIARHPRLIAVEIVGYGQDTSAKGMRAYDMLVQAESGLCAVTGTPEVPSKVGVSVADIATGMSAHAAILEALLERARTGKGKVIEIAMFDAVADWMTVPLLHLEHAGRETSRHGLSHASIYPYAPYCCKDGSIVISVQNPAEWKRFCNVVLERPELIDDPRFADNPARVRNRDALDAEIAPRFARLTLAQAMEQLERGDIAWGRISQLHELSVHPALRRIDGALPGGEAFTLPRPAGRTDNDAPKRVPGLGEHSDAIRAEFGVPVEVT
ncbi:CoA transferase (plasmid) [Aminobacter sp. SR38]|jgi:crotonobetainyl-CoA:carnitine CoA-transferase CaiB-like acyl-CoA transferase|uniref:CaiB/BaiF CoA transferase family protein n=1 Tax=Aminobacter sp. SR38 TaxID=2774562 RepID=UPI0017834E1E|nr:CoA transferase [Aminobacter sp. SR38]QOF75060.1 CoA transferase [Aminobacter sp. SR38]